ncbi:3-isopropylmalate dehydratase small subunit [Novosphingobium aquae]|uniref:3-isopropylmalate dehydratase n=1 Tax=Novosphingobium aquae TaxID=3133435 RepID=A0ABU8S758_9SPHN
MKPEPFTTVTGTAAAMAEDNVDTDIIFPARFLLLTQKKGLGAHAFHDRRFNPDGSENASFVLNKPPFREAKFLVCGDNFGSGSSREQAVWTLADFGLRVVIATSFGEIFHSNCMRNGLLPITVSKATATQLQTAAAETRRFTADLEGMILTVEGLNPIPFTLPSERRQALLMGWDETDVLLASHGDDISRFEAAQARVQPWLYQQKAPA